MSDEITRARQAAQLFVDSYRAIAGLADVLKNAEAVEKKLQSQTKEMVEMDAEYASTSGKLETLRKDLSGLRARFDAEFNEVKKEYDGRQADLSIALATARKNADAEIARLADELSARRDEHATAVAALDTDRKRAEAALADAQKALSDLRSRIG